MFAHLYAPLHVTHHTFQQLSCQTSSADTGGIGDILKNITNLLVALGSAAIVLAIVYTGYLFLTSGSSPQGMEKAKIALRNTVFAAICIFGATTVSDFIQNNIIGCGSSKSTQTLISMPIASLSQFDARHRFIVTIRSLDD